MTFNAPSFFAGAAAVLATLVVGFGGGLLVSGIMSDGTREPNKIERRAAVETKPPPAVAPAPTPAPPAAAQPASNIPGPQPADQPKAPEPQVQPQPVAQPAPLAQPQPPAQPQSQTADQVPPLGPERTVSLAQPVIQERVREPQAPSRDQEAKLRAEKRKAERRKQRDELRLEQQARIRAAERSRRLDPEDDDDDERPLFSRREPLFEPPRFPFFGN